MAKEEPKKKRIQLDQIRKEKCYIKSCSIKAKKGLYRLPENPHRRKAWIEACNWPSDVVNSTRICWKHFKKSDFLNDMDKKDAHELGPSFIHS